MFQPSFGAGCRTHPRYMFFAIGTLRQCWACLSQSDPEDKESNANKGYAFLNFLRTDTWSLGENKSNGAWFWDRQAGRLGRPATSREDFYLLEGCDLQYQRTPLNMITWLHPFVEFNRGAVALPWNKKGDPVLEVLWILGAQNPPDFSLLSCQNGSKFINIYI